MFPRGHFLMKRPVESTCPDNNLFQRIMALLSCYLSVSYKHTCACIQWSYSVDVYTKTKKCKFNHFSFLVQWPYYKAAVVYGLQPATRNPQPAARRIVNLSTISRAFHKHFFLLSNCAYKYTSYAGLFFLLSSHESLRFLSFFLSFFLLER